MSKVVYIISGFTEKINLKGYQQAIKFFKSRNYRVVPIKIYWKYKVMSDYVDDFLCSLSPYFKEDLRFLKKSWRNRVGKKRLEDLKNFSFQKLVKDITCKTLLIVGEKELKELHKRVDDAHKKIKNSELFIASNAKHEISQKEYIDKLHEVISNI